MATHNVFDKQNVEEQRAFFEHILENEPPYKVISFDPKWYLKFIDISEISITTYCEKCNSQSVFCANIEDVVQRTFSGDAFKAVGRIPVGSIPPTPIDYKEKFKNKQYFINIGISCAKCGENHYFSLLFDEDKVIKIGQYPSYSKNSTYQLAKYKNLISKYYPELTKSVNAYSQRMGVAAFVYLRRILEHLVESRYNGDPQSKFIDKLKVVEKSEVIIPVEFETIKNEIYTVLSKGVHEYEEDECLELYEAVKYVIERLLDIELEKKESAKKTSEVLKAIKSKLKSK